MLSNGKVSDKHFDLQTNPRKTAYAAFNCEHILVAAVDSEEGITCYAIDHSLPQPQTTHQLTLASFDSEHTVLLWSTPKSVFLLRQALRAATYDLTVLRRGKLQAVGSRSFRCTLRRLVAGSQQSFRFTFNQFTSRLHLWILKRRAKGIFVDELQFKL